MKRYSGGSLLIVTLLSGCGPTGPSDAARASTAIMQERIQVLEGDLTKAVNDNKLSQRTLDAAREERVRVEKQAKEEREALQKKLDGLTKVFEEYKNTYRTIARKRAPGQRMVKLDCGTDMIYNDVEILAITPGELRIRHAAGLAKVPLGRLEASLRERFAYNAAEAASWQAAELKKQEEAMESEVAATAAPKPGRTLTHVQRENKLARQNYTNNLNMLIASARALQADRNACPVHKREQMTAWSAMAARIRQKIAALPRG